VQRSSECDVAEFDGIRADCEPWGIALRHRFVAPSDRNQRIFDNRTRQKRASAVRARTSVYNGANQIVWSQDGSGRTTITYDADGNLTREVKPSGQITTSVWDAENMNSAVLLPDTTRVTYTYNADNLRVRKDTASGTRKYVFDLQNPFTETDGSDVTQAVYVVEPQTYGNIVSQRQLVGGIWNSVYYHFDALGSTGSLSDGMAVVTDTYTYTAFGETKASTGTTTNAYTWVGELGYFRDVETGSYNLHERPYEPDKARMKNPDPLGLEIDPNEYRIVGNNPVNAVDPSGMAPDGRDDEGDTEPLPRPSPRALKRMLPARLRGDKYAVGGFGGYSSKYSFRVGNRQPHHQHCPGGGPPYTTPIIERNGKYMRAAAVQAEIGAANAAMLLLTPDDFDALFEARGSDTDIELLVKCPKPPPRVPKARSPRGAQPCPTGSPEPQKPCVVTDTFHPSFVAHVLGEEAGTIRAYYPCNSDTDREIAEQTLRLARIRSGLTSLRDDIAIAIQGAQVAVVISLGGAGEVVSGVEAGAEFVETPTWSGFLTIVGMVIVSGGGRWLDEGNTGGGGKADDPTVPKPRVPPSPYPWLNFSKRQLARWLESLETQAAQVAGAGRLTEDQTRALLAYLKNEKWRIPRGVETNWVGGAHINIIGPGGGPNVHLPVPSGFVP
jgi:RHS repeat-associated protein